MVDEKEIRELLIASCHSSAAAIRFFRDHLEDQNLLRLLVHIAQDADDYEGDAPMQAAYWLSESSGAVLISHEPMLFEMLPLVDGYGGSVALALGKTGSPRGRKLIQKELGDGKRFDAWLFRRALACYTDSAG
ncbi:MAG TPA: hypothetical protein VFC46_02655 [Humisphaera sp.]|nr:hypothetical protein [Humisphaera sp.]